MFQSHPTLLSTFILCPTPVIEEIKRLIVLMEKVLNKITLLKKKNTKNKKERGFYLKDQPSYVPILI